MPRRLLRLVSKRPPEQRQHDYAFSPEDMVWAMGSFCALNRKPFDAGLLVQQFPPPYGADSFIHAARALGFKIRRKDCGEETLASLNLPCLVVMRESTSAEATTPATDLANDADSPASARVARSRPAIVVQMTAENVVFFEAGSNTPKTLPHAGFGVSYAGTAFQLALETKGINDPDGAASGQRAFGFR